MCICVCVCLRTDKNARQQQTNQLQLETRDSFKFINLLRGFRVNFVSSFQKHLLRKIAIFELGVD